MCVHTTGGVEVSSQHSTGFKGSGVDQETDMKSMSKKEQDDEDELCSIVECTDRIGSLRNAIFPYLDFVAREGIYIKTSGSALEFKIVYLHH